VNSISFNGHTAFCLSIHQKKETYAGVVVYACNGCNPHFLGG
jgi:hypothetical protein